MLGVDYASVDGNKPPDFKSARLDFAFLRGSYGTWKDPIFARDWAALRAAKVVRGAYMFPVYSGDPIVETKAFCDYVTLDAHDMPPVLDIEFPGHGIADTHMTPAQALAWLEKAGLTLLNHYGSLMLYTSARVWHEDLHDLVSSTFKGCPLWLARYPYKTNIAPQAVPSTSPPVPLQLGDSDSCWIHQFQGDSIHYPGFSHTVDINWFRPLMQGCKGDRVTWLQGKIGAKQDGDFGPLTKRALLAFLPESKGIVNPAIFARLCNLNKFPLTATF